MGVWERVEKYTMPEPNSGCWLWTGACAADGYPRITIGSLTDGSKKSVRVNRLVCEAVHGLPDGMHALHKCDNIVCINPDHLYPGTAKQNTQDCLSRGRRTQVKNGSGNSQAILTEEKVLLIRSSDKKPSSLAREHGVTVAAIYAILKRRNWRHI